MHWAAQYVGSKRGAHKCWEFVCDMQRKHFGRECPTFDLLNPADVSTVALKMEHERAKSRVWQKLEKPVDGCIVAMGHARVVHHVGLYLEADGGVVLHALGPQGVVLCDGVRQLQAKHGINLVEFLLHSSWHTNPIKV